MPASVLWGRRFKAEQEVCLQVLMLKALVSLWVTSQRGGETGRITLAPRCFIYPVRPEGPVTLPPLTQADRCGLSPPPAAVVFSQRCDFLPTDARTDALTGAASENDGERRDLRRHSRGFPLARGV